MNIHELIELKQAELKDVEARMKVADAVEKKAADAWRSDTSSEDAMDALNEAMRLSDVVYKERRPIPAEIRELQRISETGIDAPPALMSGAL